MVTTESIMNVEEVKQWLAQMLSGERFEHSLGAQEKAVELVAKYRLPQELRDKVSIAGLLHDCAKLLTPEELASYCSENKLPVDEWDLKTPQTLHPFVGAHMVETKFGIKDPDVLNAIRYHTTGRPDMGLAEKLVFIADKVEGNTRNPLYVQKITSNFDFNNVDSIDQTLLYIINSTIQFLMEKNQLIHPRTVDARNALLEEIKQKKAV